MSDHNDDHGHGLVLFTAAVVIMLMMMWAMAGCHAPASKYGYQQVVTVPGPVNGGYDILIHPDGCTTTITHVPSLLQQAAGVGSVVVGVGGGSEASAEASVTAVAAPPAVPYSCKPVSRPKPKKRKDD